MKKLMFYLFGILILIFSSIGLFADYMHRQTIKGYEELGKIYSGPVTDNYFFEVPDVGTKTRVAHMICFKPDNPPENYDLLCSSEFVSKSLAQKFPIGSNISGYFRSDIFDTLLIPAIEYWETNWFFQYLPIGALVLSLIMIIYARVSKS